MNALDAGIVPVETALEFDALRNGWSALTTDTKFVTRVGRPVVDAPGGPIYILLRGEETAGQVGIYDQTAVAGSSVPLHHQTTEDETFYVLEGRWRFQAGSVVQQAGPGMLVHAPAHTSHAFGALEGPNDIARMLSWNAPAGHERFYIGMHDSAEKGERPDIVVLQDLDGDRAGFGSFWGEVNSHVHRGLGARGVITNGSIRDIPQNASNFQMLAGSVMPSHAHVHVVDVGVPVSIAGMAVQPGDLLHADQHGAVVIPPEYAAQIPAVVAKLTAKEQVVIHAAKQPGFNWQVLKQAFQKSADIH